MTHCSFWIHFSKHFWSCVNMSGNEEYTTDLLGPEGYKNVMWMLALFTCNTHTHKPSLSVIFTSYESFHVFHINTLHRASVLNVQCWMNLLPRNPLQASPYLYCGLQQYKTQRWLWKPLHHDLLLHVKGFTDLPLAFQLFPQSHHIHLWHVVLQQTVTWHPYQNHLYDRGRGI
jgi:hypothetical protein